MLKPILVTVLLFTKAILSFAQSPYLQWQHVYGGSKWDDAYCVKQTNDGGYIVVGSSQSSDGDLTGNSGLDDYWLLKLSNAGNIEWQRSIGGTTGEIAYSVLQTNDNGYLLSGRGANYKAWIIKTNDTGAIQWQRSVGSSGGTGSCIEQTADGGYIMAGFSNSPDVPGYHGGGNDYWVVKLDDTGGIRWQKCLGGSQIDIGHCIQQTTDMGYIVAGFVRSQDGDITNSLGAEDAWVVKLDSAGNIAWEKSYGGYGADDACFIRQTPDGGYIFAGETSSTTGDVSGNHGGSDAWVVKLNAAGHIEWQKCLGGSGYERANCIRNSTDGGYIVTGMTYSDNGDVSGNHGNDDIWIIKLSGSGAVQWQFCAGDNNYEHAEYVEQTSDGGYIAAGGKSYANGERDVMVVKLGVWPAGIVPVRTNNSGLVIYPNPCYGHFTMEVPADAKKGELRVTNMLGEVVLQKEISSARADVNIVNTPGIYFVLVNAGHDIYTSKLLIQ